MPYVTSWERIAQKRGEKVGKKVGEQRGKKKGLKEGRLVLVLHLLRRRVGVLDETVKARVEKLSSARLEQLALASSDFTQPSNLERWLKRRKA